MTTYRPGSHRGTTIVRSGDGYRCGRPDHDCERGHMIAVVTNDDWALAERIAWLLAHDGTPDVTYLRGARDALAEVRRQLTAWLRVNDWSDTDDRPSPGVVDGMLRAAAAELGVDEDAPAAPRAAKPWECKLVREHNPDTEPCDCRVSQFCAMGRSLDDAPSARAVSTESDLQGSVVPTAANGGSEAQEAQR